MSKIIACLISIILNINVFAEDLTNISSFTIGSKLKARASEINKSVASSKMLVQQNDLNPLYNEIYQYLNGQQHKLGQSLTNNLNQLNSGYDLGQQNFNGITWQKPFGNFSIGINRQLSPDLFDANRWIVDDKFTIIIDAATYLSNLKEAKEITISDSQLAGFVGINFKRTYRYVHFAENFKQALVSDFNKLFMSFWKMKNGDVFNLDQYEIIAREDSMSFKAGGFISSPAIGPISINGGVLASITKLSKLQIQSIGPSDNPKPGEYLRVSSEKEYNVKVTAQAKLQADFFKLLKITLLSYDTTYSYDEVERKYFSFTKDDIKVIESQREFALELDDLINMKKFNIVKLLPFQTQGEFRKEENFGSKYSALIWGGEAERGSQTILVNRGNEQKAFIIHKAKSIRFTESVGSKLSGIILAALFQTDLSLEQYVESFSRQIELEFEADRAALVGSNFDIINEVQSSDKLSFKVVKEYKTRRKFKNNNDWQRSTDHGLAMDFVRKMSTFDNSVLKALDKGSIRSPLSVSTTLRLDKDAIQFFNNLDIQTALDTLKDLCQVSESEPKKQDYCNKMLEGKYKAYIIPYLNSGKIHTVRLKNFLYSFNNQYDDLSYYKRLFGEDLVFSSGQLKASRDNGEMYMTIFHDGEFRGLGVIDNYLREFGPAMPAPIFN